MVANVILDLERDYYSYSNFELTRNDQIWTQAIGMACHLETRRKKDLVESDRVLFHMLRLGLHDPRDKFDTPKDATTIANRYAAGIAERLWTQNDRLQEQVGPVDIACCLPIN